MEPMKPMQPMKWGEAWWPRELGEPSSSGAQNDMRYAFFPWARRLLVQENGQTTAYDSGDHRIEGVAQHDRAGTRLLTFTSQHGPVPLNELAKIS